MTEPLEIPKRLYDLIQKAARVRKSLKLNSNNRSAKRELESLESEIHVFSTCCKYITEDLPYDWIYDPETSFMAHVPKPPTSRKPKTEKKKKKKKKTKKEIQITCSPESAQVKLECASVVQHDFRPTMKNLAKGLQVDLRCD
nr:40S ribosomal protein S13 [Tanacetum cinerariifolium]